ncbi:DUF2515 family protein [Paenibacillus phyllosphaerae]|nr:DUF2515 family protein [Paenibacillus phyllosphaerae]
MNRVRQSGRDRLLEGMLRLLKMPIALWTVLVAKWHAKQASTDMAAHARPPRLREGSLKPLKAAWQSIAERRENQGSETEPAREAAQFSAWELALIERIKQETRVANRNNVTRTEAYRTLYLRRPELHWALLAHMVSRNGGYNMTDLKGELLPRLLGEPEREKIFQLLEHANSFIFGDAYPQLLLFDIACKEGRELTHLLPAFGVSRFMGPAWAHYWQRRDQVALTVALIVNEQHYIEQRIVQHPYYRSQVLDTPAFLMQAPLQLNAVVMPYGPLTDGKMQLAGLILENFSSIHERIEFGKRLYALIFGIPTLHKGVHQFMKAVRHTGSRTDFAPHLFTMRKPEASPRRYKQKLEGCRIIRGRTPFYSPELGAAWADRKLEAPELGEWYEGFHQVEVYFKELPLPDVFEMTEAYCLELNKIEAAVQAAERLDLILQKG